MHSPIIVWNPHALFVPLRNPVDQYLLENRMGRSRAEHQAHTEPLHLSWPVGFPLGCAFVSGWKAAQLPIVAVKNLGINITERIRLHLGIALNYCPPSPERTNNSKYVRFWYYFSHLPWLGREFELCKGHAEPCCRYMQI